MIRRFGLTRPILTAIGAVVLLGAVASRPYTLAEATTAQRSASRASRLEGSLRGLAVPEAASLLLLGTGLVGLGALVRRRRRA